MIFCFFITNATLIYIRMIQLYMYIRTIATLVLQIEFGNAQHWNKRYKINIHVMKISSMLVGTRNRLKESHTLCKQAGAKIIKACPSRHSLNPQWWKSYLFTFNRLFVFSYRIKISPIYSWLHMFLQMSKAVSIKSYILPNKGYGSVI